jgi:alpha-glucosidase (family GH31 glycosyl hydrolase)
MPFYVDARGFGVLVETDRRTVVDVCATDPEVAWLEVESAEPWSALVFTGPTPADVVSQLGDEVGRPTAPPPWAYSAHDPSTHSHDRVGARDGGSWVAHRPSQGSWPLGTGYSCADWRAGYRRVLR